MTAVWFARKFTTGSRSRSFGRRLKIILVAAAVGAAVRARSRAQALPTLRRPELRLAELEVEVQEHGFFGRLIGP